MRSPSRCLACFLSICLTAAFSAAVWGQISALPPTTVGQDSTLRYEHELGRPLFRRAGEPEAHMSPSGVLTVTAPARPGAARTSPPLAGEYGVVERGAPGGPMAPIAPGAGTPILDGTPVLDSSAATGQCLGAEACSAPSCWDCWTWQLLPDGLMFPAYLAGGRESRLGAQWVYVRGHGWFWDSTLGGHVGALRYGNEDGPWPEGWQLDFEAAAFPRLDLESDRDLTSSDYRVGVPLTFRKGPLEGKLAYYHLSSHLGDEFMLKNPSYPRINYVRDCVVLALAVRPWRALRLYSEVGYAFYIDGGAEPWEFQFGAEISPAEPNSCFGAPFFAVNGHLRQENDFGGNIAVQAGWSWRSRTGHLVRLGAHYFNGLSDNYQFFDKHEDQVGLGLWYDY